MKNMMIRVIIFSGIACNVFGSLEPFSVSEAIERMGIQNYSGTVQDNRQELKDRFKQAKEFYTTESTTTTTTDSDGHSCVTVNTRLIDIPVTDEKKETIFGCLAIESLLRNHREEHNQQAQLVHEKFGDQSVLGNQDLVFLLGTICYKKAYGEQTSLQIARAIDVCNPAVKNHRTTSELLEQFQLQAQQLSEQESDQLWHQTIQNELHSSSRPLMNAAQSNFTAMCQLLIDLGADVQFEADKRTCLHTALNRKNLQMFTLFYNAGLRYAKQGEDLSRTVYRYRRHAPQIHQYCVEQGIIQAPQQIANQSMDIEQ